MNSRQIIAAAGLLLLALASPLRAAGDFAYVRASRPALDAGAVVIDARPLDACTQRSFAGARCLAAAEFLGPHRRLAGYRDILWLLGTAGLRGNETVLVVGQDPLERDFVAGLLHLAGQARVLILTAPATRELAGGIPAAPGVARSFTREAVFEAPMRDTLVVLGRELRGMQPAPLLLDGRSAEEYWGETVRAARGGHLPGAVSLPAAQLRAAEKTPGTPLPAGSPVAYGHDAVEGIAYLTLLRAGHDTPARVYVEGWAEWAANGALPADSVAYPDRAPVPGASPAEGSPRGGESPAGPWVAGAAILAALAAAFVLGRAMGRGSAA